MRMIKKVVRKVLRSLSPDLEYRMAEQYHFDQLKRKPPELMWKALDPCVEPRNDAGRVHVGHELFVVGGFLWKDSDIVNAVDIFDLDKEKWTGRIPMPGHVPQTHLGIACDGKRYAYFISGQLGGQCRPAVKDCFVFDTKERTFHEFPPLPKARYAPTVQIWNGRLHSIGGALEDRNGPGTDHWSIAVANGQALENNWREEVPIPRGGHHRASAVADGNLYVFGGQEGDYIAIPGDPHFKCTGKLTKEIRFPDVYRLEQGAKQWKKMADMPILASHTENAVVVIDNKVYIFGGDYDRKANESIVSLNDEIQVYDIRTDSWSIYGKLPYRVKTMVGAYYKGSYYFTNGQRDRGMGDAVPARCFERGMWKAKF